MTAATKALLLYTKAKQGARATINDAVAAYGTLHATHRIAKGVEVGEVNRGQLMALRHKYDGATIKLVLLQEGRPRGSVYQPSLPPGMQELLDLE